MISRSSVTLVGRHRRRVLHRAVEAEVLDDDVEVGVGRERSEVAQGLELHAYVVDGRTDDQTHEGASPLGVQPAGGAVVQQGDAAVGLDQMFPRCRSP